MQEQYVIFVEFKESLDGRVPVTQTLEVKATGREFDVLLHALNASPSVAILQTYCKSAHGVSRKMFKITREDLGYLTPDIMEKLR